MTCEYLGITPVRVPRSNEKKIAMRHCCHLPHKKNQFHEGRAGSTQCTQELCCGGEETCCHHPELLFWHRNLRN